jgi:hypothetical protein
MIHNIDDKNIIAIHKWEVKDTEQNNGYDIDGFIIHNDEIYNIEHFTRENNRYEKFIYIMITMKNGIKYRIECDDVKPILKRYIRSLSLKEVLDEDS